MKIALFAITALCLISSHVYAACDIPVRAKSYTKYSQGTYFDAISVPKSTMADLSTSPSYNYAAHFKNTVKTKTKTDYNFLLNRQKPFYKNFPEETLRFDKVLSKKIGRVRHASCLETFLLDNHLRTFSSETEFSAYVLTKFDSENVIVVLYTQTNNGTVADLSVTNLVEGYRKQGWALESHIHNHPFAFKNPYGDIAGTILPSSPDLATYQQLGESAGLRSGIVTNGFETYILYRNDFNRL